MKKLFAKRSNLFIKQTGFKTFLLRVKNFLNKRKEDANLTYNEELTSYINKIFEQQEKERIVRWLVNSIRKTLELDKVLETIVKEIGTLLKVDRCLIALFEKEKQKFYFRSEYRKNSSILVLNSSEKTECKLPLNWHDCLVNKFIPLIINRCENSRLSLEETEYLLQNNIKSLIIIPVVHKEELLGILMVHQTEYLRSWEEAHFELLNDTGSQIAIAVNQAILYSRIKEATRLKSEFLAGMSHELRTPLNAVIGFSEMLLSENYGKINEKQKKFLKNIFVSGDHLLRLVNDILDLSKIESGNMEINYEKFYVKTAINETISVLNGLAANRKVVIETNGDLNLFLTADLRRFKQIMYNLLCNAIKFSHENGKVVVNSIKTGNNIKIEVIDNGIGISKEDRDKIFKKFRQLDSALSRKEEGTGLGLTLTKKLIELHKGAIDFESEKDKGSNFWFVIPEN